MNKYDLSGKWQLFMDSGCTESIPFAYNDEIMLPGTTSHACKGKKSDQRAPDHLTDPYLFEGYAWYKRNIEVKEEWQGKELFLRLERTRMTVLYADGMRIGSCDSLCASHVYKLPQLEAGLHTIEICVKNVGYPTRGGHMTSPDTQTNWNGITGAIELIVRPRIRIDDIAVLSSSSPEKVDISFHSDGAGEAYVTVDSGKTVTISVCEGTNSIVYIPDKPLAVWDEFSPELHKLRISMNGEMNTVTFGIRTLATKGRKLLINGREVFLRGKHDGMVFPLTGFAPTDTESWLAVMKTAKRYGINHYRFHTCCPPDAAFTAADILGIYMEPELPFWGTIDEKITDEQRYLTDEGFRILREFGSHPSFVMMSLGNELWGSKERLGDMLADYKRFDDRHLYLDGSNNFQFFPTVTENSDLLCGVRLSRDRLYRGSYAMCDAPQGFIQTDEPNSAHSYDGVIVPEKLGESTAGGKIQIQYGTGVKEVEASAAEMFIPEVPVISHEVGQYETYPDFTEMEKYTGTLKAENIALYREKAEKNGLIEYSDRFFRASGALAADCYKREIEAALGSSELSGFQLLDLQDFPGQGTALVGVLNAFMEPKGIISEEQWRCFCAPTVIMAQFSRFVFSAKETIEFVIKLFNTDPDFTAKRISYQIDRNDETEQFGHVRVLTGNRVNTLGKIAFDAADITAPTVYRLSLRADGTDVRNEYSFIVYPDADITVTADAMTSHGAAVRIAHSEKEAAGFIAAGEKVLLVPDSLGKLEGTYCTDFWCYPMFRSISESMEKPVPIGTMGCLIDNKSPLLSSFPSESYSTPQWWSIVSHSHCEDLSGTDIVPAVWVIDNPDRAKKLALLYEKPLNGRMLTVCTSRLWEIADRPEAKYLALSLFRYITK